MSCEAGIRFCKPWIDANRLLEVVRRLIESRRSSLLEKSGP